MAIQKHARDVLFFDMLVGRRAEQAPFPKVADLVPLWTQAKSANFPPKEFEKGNVTVIVKDCELDEENKILTLLLEVSDKNAPNATYLNHQERTARHLKKDVPEGNGHSAHVMVSLEETPGQPNSYLTLIESIPYVSIAKIQSTLNTAIRVICKDQKGLFTYVRPGGGNKAIPYVPHIVLGGHPSDRFMRDLEEGIINGIKLIAPAPNKVLGQGDFLKVDKYSLEVKVSKDIPHGDRWKTIFGGVHMSKDEFPTARIFVQPEHGGKSFHVDIDADTGGLIGDAYVKARRISPINPLLETSSADSIVPHFSQKMKEILLKERE